MTEEDKLRTALAEAQTRERIAVQELQKMRQRAQDAEKALQELEELKCEFSNQCKIRI